MVIRHNLEALNAGRQNGLVAAFYQKSCEKLSSGYRINRAADDAAGLSISEKMRKQIRGLRQASDNAQDGISLLQVADGALHEVHDMIQRINELSVKAANGSNSDEDRLCIQDEIDQIIEEVDRIADVTSFNELKLLDGSCSMAGEVKHSPPEDSEESSKDMADSTEAIQTVILTEGMESADGAVVVNPVVGSGNVTGTQANKMNNVLMNEIVPQAVNAFLNTFSAFKTASDNGQVSAGIGLELYNNASSTVLASVSISYGYTQPSKQIVPDSIKLKLSVNTATLGLDAGGNMSAENRTALETTIVHEMMHAFMDDTLINGMVGANNGVLDSSNKFPDWFVEGMAQSAAGGCSNLNDWVNGGSGTSANGGLGLNSASSANVIKNTVQRSTNKLGSGSVSSQYGTGYLACMYLGYLAAGSPAGVTSADMKRGLNTILHDLMAGDSLNDVIKNVSGNAYSGVTDFQNKFGDAASAAFVNKLLTVVGSTGNGGVVASGGDALTQSDLLSDSSATSSVYKVDPTKEFVTSSVGGNRNWGGGGGTKTGSGGGTGGGTGGPSGPGGGTGGPSGPSGPGGGPSGPGGTGGTGGTGDNGGHTGYKGPLSLQVGAEAGQRMEISIEDAHASSLGIDELSVKTVDDATKAIDLCSHALERVSAIRSKLGAEINRLEHTINNLDNVVENTQMAESRIRDTDMSTEIVKFSNNQILQQAGNSMLAQANQNGQLVLNLLG